MILLKKNILSEELVENLKDKKEEKEKIKFLGKKKHAEDSISKEQLVTEFKIGKKISKKIEKKEN